MAIRIMEPIFWNKKDHQGLHRSTWMVTNPAQVKECLARYSRARYVGVDSETTSLNPFAPGARTRLLQIADEHDVTVFDLFKLKKQSLGWIWRWLEDPARVKVIQNAKFDLRFWIREFGVGEISPLFDTLIAGQVLNLGFEYEDRDDGSGKKQHVKHNLARLLHTYLGVKMPKDVDHNWGGELTQGQLVYASNDAAHLVDLRAAMVEVVKERGLARGLNIELRAVQPTAQRELNGILFDQKKWRRIHADNRKKLTDVEQKLKKALDPVAGDNMDLFEGGPPAFNMNSYPEIKERVKAMGIKLPTILDQDTKKIKDTMTLDKMAQISGHHPVISLLISRARLAKAISSYGNKFLRWIDPYDGRAHPDIAQIGTVTTRESAKEPPVHGIPKQSDHRECVVAPPGHKLVWADYSQIELRILAELSGDRNMLKAFLEGLDLHTQTASLIFGVEYDAVVTIQRRRAKDLNFGIPYGVGPDRFAERSGMSKEASEKIMADHAKKYPQENAYLNSAASHARIYGYVTTMSGKVIGFRFDKNNKREVGAVGRHGKNYPIQGSSADITKTAIRMVHDGIRVFREKGGGWPMKLVQVAHDEIVLEVRDDHVEVAKSVLHDNMVAAGREFLKTVPVVVDVSVNQYWKKREDN